MGNPMNRSVSDTLTLVTPGGTEPALGPVLAPCQLRDLSFAAIGARFSPELVAASLPPNLKAPGDGSGGFLVALAREGHRLAPYSTGHIWFDVLGLDGTAGACRFLPRPFRATARPGKGKDRQRGARLCEGAEDLVASLNTLSGPAFRMTLRPKRNWGPNAGIDHSIADGAAGRPATRLTITPWACDWCDALPVSVEVLSPHWAALAPQSLTWAAVGRSAALTLGLASPLAR